MKRSERLAHLRASLQKHCPVLIDRAVETISEQLLREEEAAFGLKWDPEEEPLPERLTVYRLGNKTFEVRAKINPYNSAPLTLPQAEEVVRRYHAFPGLKQLALTVKSYTWNGSAANDAACALLAILGGTREEAPRG